ncbi:hypothetical protein CJO78_21805 (plasmid) [Ralstonia solanacearum]|nr:hypothetical protein CJO78_21805 [Ralstonia solanacearum]AXW08395.1 hypothetical protein CJO82_21475 [Ralstonia solanacearum]AXW26183.1 hypothetical protein CJO86_21740 [Ralstonia solanacearum]AXW64291.1 hypothetical protein CJO94_21660 [Ralstonia solanacearum]AXW83094.1 hypothetical protein CJO98_21835 [Ralstonia solanacearum]
MHLRVAFHPAFNFLNPIPSLPGPVIAKAMKRSHKSAISVRAGCRLPQSQCRRGYPIHSRVHSAERALNRRAVDL